MVMSYATIDGRVTIPGTDIGIHARVEAIPQTRDEVLTFPANNRMTWGPVTSTSRPNDGAINPSMQIPIAEGASGVVWKFTFTPLDKNRGVAPWSRMYSITASGRLEDLVETEAITVTPEVITSVQTYANDAQTSATNAATSETNAATSATAAASSATAADGSKTAAAASKTAAATSETNAAASASSASTSAGTATTKASEASTSASNAATSASNAATSASTATTKASEAAMSASNAASSAASVPGMWQPSTVYTAGSVKVAPDGSTISRNADGTSRATFDATEQAAWTVVAAKAGTLENTALTATFVPQTQDATTSAKGIVRLATSAETVTGTATDRVLTPAGGAAAFTPKVGTGAHPLTGRFHVDGYGADPTGVANSDAAWAAVMTAVNASGGVVYAPGKYAVSTGVIVIAHDDVRIEGLTLKVSAITGTGAGSVISYDSSATRQHCGLDDLRVVAATDGASAYNVQNSYRGKHNRCRFEAWGATSTAVDVIEGVGQSTYFNVFRDCDAIGGLNALRLSGSTSGGVSSVVWDCGVLEGPGRSLHVKQGSAQLLNVGIQSDGTNTSGVIVEFGESGVTHATRAADNSTMLSCRFETSTPTSVVFRANGWNNVIFGGSTANVTYTDETTGLSGGNSPYNSVMIMGLAVSKWRGAFDTTALTAYSMQTIDPADPGQLKFFRDQIIAAGTGTNQAINLRAKGNEAVRINQVANDGTGGLVVYSGGASSVTRAVIGATDGFRSFPAAGGAILQGWKSGETNFRLKIGETGKHEWGDGAAAFDTNLYRDAADALRTDDRFQTAGLSLGYVAKTAAYTLTSLDYTVNADATTAAFSLTLPTAVGRAGQVYVLRKSDASANVVTVATTSAQTINGAASYSLSAQYQTVRVQSDGANWMIV